VLVSRHRRIRRLEEQVGVQRSLSEGELAAERQAHREAIAHLERRCEEDDDPTNRRAAVADLAQFLRERGKL
jgi:hypothetical protein